MNASSEVNICQLVKPGLFLLGKGENETKIARILGVGLTGKSSRGKATTTPALSLTHGTVANHVKQRGRKIPGDMHKAEGIESRNNHCCEGQGVLFRGR